MEMVGVYNSSDFTDFWHNSRLSSLIYNLSKHHLKSLYKTSSRSSHLFNSLQWKVLYRTHKHQSEFSTPFKDYYVRCEQVCNCILQLLMWLRPAIAGRSWKLLRKGSRSPAPKQASLLIPFPSYHLLLTHIQLSAN